MPGGVRMGAPALTSRGFIEDDFKQVANFVDRFGMTLQLPCCALALSGYDSAWCTRVMLVYIYLLALHAVYFQTLPSAPAGCTTCSLFHAFASGSKVCSAVLLVVTTGVFDYFSKPVFGILLQCVVFG